MLPSSISERLSFLCLSRPCSDEWRCEYTCASRVVTTRHYTHGVTLERPSCDCYHAVMVDSGDYYRSVMMDNGDYYRSVMMDNGDYYRSVMMDSGDYYRSVMMDSGD